MTARDDWIVLVAVAAIVAGTIAIAHFTPGPKPEAASTAAGPDAACAEWTDGCIVCQRIDGEPMCSTPGIACVRGEMRCLRQTVEK